MLGLMVWCGGGLCAGLPLSGADGTGRAPPEPVRATARAGLQYVEREGRRWLREQRCASCHHGPMLIWTLGAAAARELPVDQSDLPALTRQLLLEYGEANFRPTAVDTAPFSLGALYLLLGANAGPLHSELGPLQEHVLQSQLPDGSWPAPDLQAPDLEVGRKPPFFDTRQVTTGWALWALGRLPGAESLEPVRRGLEWLERQNEPPDTQAAVLRLLLASRFRPDRKAAATQRLLALQRPDGGWGQAGDLPSDAFATGQALYALGEAGFRGGGLSRARRFLTFTQQPDGSWLVPSRHSEEQGIATGYSGTAWAVLGMLATSPPGEW